MKSTGIALFGAVRVRVIGFTLSIILMLVCATVAYAQTAEDQYGSPTDTVDPVGDVLGVLPDTGGPLLLLAAGGVLVVAGIGLAIRRRSASRR